MNRRIFFFVLFTALLLILALGCAKKECRRDNDCIARPCLAVSCLENKCVAVPKCAGRYVLEEKGAVKVYAKYLQKLCDETTGRCYWGVNKSIITTYPLVAEKDIPGFRLELGVAYNKPFDLANDALEVSLLLKDYDESYSALPLRIKKMQVLAGDIKYGEVILKKDINNLGGAIKEKIPLAFRPEKKELEAVLRLKIDYEYEKLTSKGNITERGTLQHSFSEKIFFVVTGGIDE